MAVWKIGKKTRKILAVYAIILSCGLYLLFVDFAIVSNQVIIFEKDVNFITADEKSRLEPEVHFTEDTYENV